MSHIFLSYSRKDLQRARAVYDGLVKAGFEVWFDKKNLIGGQYWKAEIAKAIKNAALVIVLLSKQSVDGRGYMHKEIKDALDVMDEMPEGRVYLVPVRLDDFPPPQKLEEIHCEDLFDDRDIPDLIAKIRRLQQSAAVAISTQPVFTPLRYDLFNYLGVKPATPESKPATPEPIKPLSGIEKDWFLRTDPISSILADADSLGAKPTPPPISPASPTPQIGLKAGAVEGVSLLAGMLKTPSLLTTPALKPAPSSPSQPQPSLKQYKFYELALAFLPDMIIPGLGAAGVRLDATRDQVIKQLGTPEDTWDINRGLLQPLRTLPTFPKYSESLYYYQKGVALFMLLGKVSTITLYGPGHAKFSAYTGTTPEKVGPTSNRFQIQAALGFPTFDLKGLTTEQHLTTTYNALGLTIVYRASSFFDMNAPVEYIRLAKPAEPA